jgi:hypothetical protein
MIFEDERTPVQEQLQFVLHLGDFIYEIVWYPEDRPQGMYDRRIRDIVRYQTGKRFATFISPQPSTTTDPSIVRTCTIRICRTPVPAGRS